MYDEIDDDTLRKAEAECMTRPSNSAMWDDRLYTTHGPVLSWAERGDDRLSESNYLMVLDTLKATAANTEHEDRDCCWDEDGKKRGWGTSESPHDDDVIDASISDWLVGSLRQLFVRVRDDEGEFTPTFREAVSISLALRDYPVYDESDYSEREWEDFESTLTDALESAETSANSDLFDRDEEDVTPEEDESARAHVHQTLSDEGQWCRSEDVDYDHIAKLYLSHVTEMRKADLEKYARSLIPTQPETLFD